MYNSSFYGADRATHLKIVVIALIASIAMMCVGIAGRLGAYSATAQFQAEPVMKAGKPVVFTRAEATIVR